MKAPPLPSERSFGILFTVVFALLAGWIYWKAGPASKWWIPASLSGLFLVLSFVAPIVLRPLNIVWMKFGLLLGMIVSPIALGVIFFLAVTPFALVMKLAKRDALLLKLNKDARSYWVPRDPPGPNGPESFPRQF
jgi:hypothetical protein